MSPRIWEWAFSLGLAYVQTNAKDYAYVNPQGNSLGRAGFLANLTKTFDFPGRTA